MSRRLLKPLPPKVLLGGGRQAAHVLNLMEWMGLRWQDVRLFDDAFPASPQGARGLPLAGTLAQGAELCLRRKLPVMVALGSRNAALRYATFRRLQEAGARLVSLLHPTCQIGPGATVGANTLMMPGAVLGAGVRLGALACLFANVTVEHDTQVGDSVVFGPGVTVSGCAQIGSHVFLGAGAVVAPEVKIGERTLVGAGAVVVSDLPVGIVAVGVPARARRDVRSGDDAPTLEDLRKLGC